MSALVLYILVAAALHYVLGFAQITEWARSWRHMPGAVTSWLWCPFCSGFWYGLALAVTVGRDQDLALLGLPGRLWYTPILAGFITMITTPAVRGHVFVLHRSSVEVITGGGAPGPVPDASPPDLRVV